MNLARETKAAWEARQDDKVWARVVVTETSSRKNWQKLVIDQTGGAQKRGVMMTQSQKAARFGVNSQMVSASRHALAHWPPKVKVSQLWHSAHFWEWGLHIPSFPLTQFYMLVVISCNSHLQGGEGDGWVDNSFVHHEVINTSQ